MELVLFYYGAPTKESGNTYAEEKNLQRHGDCAACHVDWLIDSLIHTDSH